MKFLPHSADITYVILKKLEKESKIEHNVGLPLGGPAVAADIYFPDAFHWSNVTKTISKPACPHQFSELLITNL